MFQKINKLMLSQLTRNFCSKLTKSTHFSSKIIHRRASSTSSLTKLDKLNALSKLILMNNYPSVKEWINQFEHVLEKKENSKAVTFAACFNYGEITKLLADQGLNLEIRDVYNRTPIEWAAYYGNHGLINSLLSLGANTAGDSWNSCKAPLHYILDGTWKSLGKFDELEQNIESAEILKRSYDNDSPQISFENHSQTSENDLVILDRIQNGINDTPLLEEMKRFSGL